MYLIYCANRQKSSYDIAKQAYLIFCYGELFWGKINFQRTVPFREGKQKCRSQSLLLFIAFKAN